VLKANGLRPAAHLRLLRRTRWRLALRAAALVMAVLAVLSGGAYVVARRVLFGRLHERLETAARSGDWQRDAATRGYVIVGDSRPATAAQPPARQGDGDQPRFAVSADARYGALAILRYPVGAGGSNLLATPARDDVQALETFLAILAALTLAGGLAALPAGYLLAGHALHPLDEAVRERAEFVALASHRLRTPLSVIRTSAELAMSGQGLDPPQALRTILDQTVQMEGLAARLTALARAEAQRDRPRSVCDLGAVAAGVSESLRPVSVRNKTELALVVAEPVWVAAPESDVLDMLTSVVENAVQFNSPGGCVTIRVFPSGRWGMAEVADEGPGIDPADLASVTKPFFQGRRARGGAGLGLAIAGATAGRLGGRLQISSEAGAGTTVRIRLPLGRRPPAPHRLRQG